MAMEAQFNPATGSGEIISGDSPNEQNNQVSAQDLSDQAQARAFRNTAENLSQRAFEKQGGDVSQVGSGDVDVEIKLQETQRELYQLQNGTLPSNPLRMLQLEALQNKLAESLVSGEPVLDTAPPEEPWDPKADLEEGLASDPAVQETHQWRADAFSEETNKPLHEM